MTVPTLTFVGSGDAFGSGGRLQACLMLDGPPGKILLDCGASSLIGLKRLGIAPNEIQAVVLTHLHGDHFGGLPFLVLDGQFSRRERDLVVVGPRGTEARVRAAMEVFYPGSTAVQRAFAVRFLELNPAVPTDLDGVQVSCLPVDHASGADAFAVRAGYGGKSVTYTGDFAWNDNVASFAAGSDLFVREGYMLERRVKYHASFSDLQPHLATTLFGTRVILTHMGPEMLANPGAVPVETASDGLVVTL